MRYIFSVYSFWFGWRSLFGGFDHTKLLIGFVTISWVGISQIIHILLMGFLSIVIVDFVEKRLCRIVKETGSRLERRKQC